MTPAIPTYCTNVHAGRTLEETEANLDRFAVRVRELTAPESDPAAPIGLGLLDIKDACMMILQHIPADITRWQM